MSAAEVRVAQLPVMREYNMTMNPADSESRMTVMARASSNLPEVNWVAMLTVTT
jgi:hypothetical protein